MKTKHLILGIAATIVLSSSALAQRITWTPISVNNFNWANAPGQHSVTTYRQIGNFTYGNDGSRAYNQGQAEQPVQRELFTPFQSSAPTLPSPTNVATCVRVGFTIQCN